MKNIDRIAKHIAKNGAKNILIHSIAGTRNWIVCCKIENNLWSLTLMEPLGSATYNLGLVNDKQHSELWTKLILLKIENKASTIQQANKYKEIVYKFTKNYEQIFKNFKKINTSWD